MPSTIWPCALPLSFMLLPSLAKFRSGAQQPSDRAFYAKPGWGARAPRRGPARTREARLRIREERMQEVWASQIKALIGTWHYTVKGDSHKYTIKTKPSVGKILFHEKVLGHVVQGPLHQEREWLQGKTPNGWIRIKLYDSSGHKAVSNIKKAGDNASWGEDLIATKDIQQTSIFGEVESFENALPEYKTWMDRSAEPKQKGDCKSVAQNDYKKQKIADCLRSETDEEEEDSDVWAVQPYHKRQKIADCLRSESDGEEADSDAWATRPPKHNAADCSRFSSEKEKEESGNRRPAAHSHSVNRRVSRTDREDQKASSRRHSVVPSYARDSDSEEESKFLLREKTATVKMSQRFEDDGPWSQDGVGQLLMRALFGGATCVGAVIVITWRHCEDKLSFQPLLA